jgi:hypothetical protein
MEPTFSPENAQARVMQDASTRAELIQRLSLCYSRRTGRKGTDPIARWGRAVALAQAIFRSGR